MRKLIAKPFVHGVIVSAMFWVVFAEIFPGAAQAWVSTRMRKSVNSAVNAGGETRVIFTSGTSWTVPAEWTSPQSRVEVLGGGGAGGGGGAYSRTDNVSLTSGSTTAYAIGPGGAGNGGDTYFCVSSSNCSSISGSSVIAGAKGGLAGSTGGQASQSIGSLKYSGGNVGCDTVGTAQGGGPGGGGAAGPSGAGANGGCNGYGNGGNGGTGNASLGGGGGSGSGSYGTGSAGSAGSEWNGVIGSGGGGGGGGSGHASSNGGPGGAGGSYGAGGGRGGFSGASSSDGPNGAGAPGVIVLTYKAKRANKMPLMTAATTAGVTVTSGPSDYYPAWKAFDGGNGDGFYWYNYPGTSAVMTIDFGSNLARKIKSYKITSGHVSYHPTSWTIQGSNNGSSWTTIDTRSGIACATAGTSATYDIADPNQALYRYYRMNASSGCGGNGVIVGEMEWWN